jgi:hypothetical protein
MPRGWVWLLWLLIFVGLEWRASVYHDIPTLTATVIHYFPAWITLPTLAFLWCHFLQRYLGVRGN